MLRRIAGAYWKHAAHLVPGDVALLEPGGPLHAVREVIPVAGRVQVDIGGVVQLLQPHHLIEVVPHPELLAALHALHKLTIHVAHHDHGPTREAEREAVALLAPYIKRGVLE